MTFSLTANLLISAIYYMLVVIMAFFSAFGVYVLLRYGEKRMLALVVGLVYSFFFLTILVQSYSSLQKIL